MAGKLGNDPTILTLFFFCGCFFPSLWLETYKAQQAWTDQVNTQTFTGFPVEASLGQNLSEIISGLPVNHAEAASWL